MKTKRLSILFLLATALLMVLSTVTSSAISLRAATEEPTVAPTPTLAPTVMAGGEGCAANAPKVTWYVGLGSGTDADVIPKEKAWVDAFNKAHTDACVLLQVVHNPESYD